MKKYVHLQTMCYERITYPNFSSIKPIPSKKWYRKIKKRANYRYDALNRITSGIDNTGNYNLTSVVYDKNGNITHLERKGHTNVGATNFGTMDNLVYTYETNSNKLKKVLDNGNDTFGFKDVVNLTTEYVYDANGNLVKDLNKGIGTSSVNGITYNHLNLPTEIKFDNSSTKKINYTYDATGVKLQKVVNDGGNLTTTDYANGYVYENNTLQFFNHPEGYVHNDNGTFKYVYNYLDHLGSIRLSYSDGDGNGSISQSEIIEENNYYPYGLKMRGFNEGISSLGNSLAQKFKFQGQEFDESFNQTLNTYEFGLRQYDPALGRWFNTDPYEQFNSPYVAMGNNPVISIDPDGGFCFDANGTQIACPENELFDDARGSDKVHEYIMDEVVVDNDSNSEDSDDSDSEDESLEVSIEYRYIEMNNDVGMFEVSPLLSGPFKKGIAIGKGFLKDILKTGSKTLLKRAKLPIKGKIRFIPRSSDIKNGKLLKNKVGGYIDKFGNIWKKGPSRTAGEAFEWDVQLSKTGKNMLGHLSRDGKHLNVSLGGKITH